jgi:hypothetical protein
VHNEVLSGYPSVTIEDMTKRPIDHIREIRGFTIDELHTIFSYVL